MADIAKVPHWRDLDEGYQGQFLQHWVKRHSYPGVFDDTHETFQDDSQPLWFAIRGLHDKIHDGESEFPVPEDHVHLEPLDAAIARQLDELI